MRSSTRVRTTPYTALLALLTTAACAGPEWRQPPSTETWQARSLWTTGHAVVAARHEDDAAECIELWEQLCEAFRRAGVTAPAPPLFLVLGADDEFCRSTPEATCTQLEEWHRAFTWAALNGTPGAKPPPTQNPRVPPEFTVEDARAMTAAAAGLVTAAVALPEGSLQLPPTWQPMSSWALLLPSDARLVRDGDRVLDLGLAALHMSWMQEVLLAPLLPIVRSKARNNLRAQVRRRATEACAVTAHEGRAVPPELLQRLLREMDVPDPLAYRPDDETIVTEEPTTAHPTGDAGTPGERGTNRGSSK